MLFRDHVKDAPGLSTFGKVGVGVQPFRNPVVIEGRAAQVDRTRTPLCHSRRIHVTAVDEIRTLLKQSLPEQNPMDYPSHKL